MAHAWRHADDPRLQLAPPGERARFWLFALGVALPLGITSLAIALVVADGGPLKLIGDSLPLTVALTLGTLALLCGAIWWGLSRAMLRRSLQVSAGVLLVRSSFYRCRVPMSQVDLGRARVVDLDEHTELKPMLKVNGFSLPGFRSGWFLLRNRRRGFLALGDGRRALWLPTGDAHDLLIQPADPAALLAHLRSLAADRGAG